MADDQATAPSSDAHGGQQRKSSLHTLSNTAVAQPSQKHHGASHQPRGQRRQLNPQQVAELLQTFWTELLQNNVKAIRKILTENHLKMDFPAARHRLHSDGTALHICAQRGFMVAAQLLLDFGVDINSQNKVGLTPLHMACKFHQTAMAAFLLEKGALLDIPDHVRFRGLSVLVCILGVMD